MSNLPFINPPRDNCSPEQRRFNQQVAVAINDLIRRGVLVMTGNEIFRLYTDPSLTVEAVSGTPSYENIGTIRFDESDGFAVSQPAAGIVRIDFAPVSYLTVKESDGSPSYTQIYTLEFDQDDGFVISQPSVGQAKVNYGITVRQVDGLAAFNHIKILDFDQDDGFTVSQPVSGNAVVSFTPQLTVKESDGSPSYTAITSLEFDQDDGFTVSQPGTGRAKIDFTPPTVVLASGNVAASVSLTTDDAWTDLSGSASSLDAGTYLFTATLIGKFELDVTSPAGQFGAIIARFRNHTTSTTASVQWRIVIGNSLTDEMHGNGTLSAVITVAQNDEVRVQARRNTTPFGGAACVYTSASIATQANDTDAGQTNICWHRLY